MSEVFQGTEAGNQIAPAYAYIITMEDVAERMFLVAYQRPVSISDMPPVYGATDPQTFDVAQISHGEHGLSADWDGKPLSLSLTTQNTAIAEYFATASATRITVAIFRLNSARLLTGEALQFGVDCILINSGQMGKVSFNGQNITAEVLPLPFGSNQTLPRYWFTYTCNHVFGDAKTCKVNLAAFTHTATIDEIQQSARMLTLSITAPGGDATYFRSGVFIHGPTGQHAGIDRSDAGGPGGKVRIWLRVWNMAFDLGQTVTVRAGCRRTTEDCDNKFSNKENYGGFPYVPNRNPVLYGVGA